MTFKSCVWTNPQKREESLEEHHILLAHMTKQIPSRDKMCDLTFQE